MTWHEFQTRFDAVPLPHMDLERLQELAAVSLDADASSRDRTNLDEAQRNIRNEIDMRNIRAVRHEEADFRRQERHHSNRQHEEHVAQSSRMHVSQMERAHFAFVFHRRFIWIATIIALVSALIAWYSLWTQRAETRRALDEVRGRLEVLEAGRNQPE